MNLNKNLESCLCTCMPVGDSKFYFPTNNDAFQTENFAKQSQNLRTMNTAAYKQLSVYC